MHEVMARAARNRYLLLVGDTFSYSCPLHNLKQRYNVTNTGFIKYTTTPQAEVEKRNTRRNDLFHFQTFRFFKMGT